MSPYFSCIFKLSSSSSSGNVDFVATECPPGVSFNFFLGGCAMCFLSFLNLSLILVFQQSWEKEVIVTHCDDGTHLMTYFLIQEPCVSIQAVWDGKAVLHFSLRIKTEAREQSGVHLDYLPKSQNMPPYVQNI